MDKWQREIDTMLKAAGATARHGRHTVYQLPNQRNFTVAPFHHDWRAARNAVHKLRHLIEAPPPTAPDLTAAVPEAAAVTHERIVVPNWPERHRDDINIPELADAFAATSNLPKPISVPAAAPDPVAGKIPLGQTQSLDVCDMVRTLREQESFWALPPCGRILLFRRLVGGAGVAASVVGVRAFIISTSIINDAATECSEEGEHHTLLANFLKQAARATAAAPALWVSAPQPGIPDAIWEINFFELAAGVRDFYAVAVKHQELKTGGVWFRSLNARLSILYHYVGREHDRFRKDPAWYNPRVLRPVLQELGSRMGFDPAALPAAVR